MTDERENLSGKFRKLLGKTLILSSSALAILKIARAEMPEFCGKIRGMLCLLRPGAL